MTDLMERAFGGSARQLVLHALTAPLAGAVVAGLLAAALGLLRRHRAGTRYGIACLALGLMALYPVTTFFLRRTAPRRRTLTSVERSATPSRAPLYSSSPLLSLRTVRRMPAGSTRQLMQPPVLCIIDQEGAGWWIRLRC